MQSNVGCHEPSCLLSHVLVNKLSVIIGNCELLEEQAQAGSECAKRLGLIRDVAQEMAEELNKHQCKLSEVVRMKVAEKPLVSRR